MVEVRDVRLGDLLATPDGPAEVTALAECFWSRDGEPRLGVGGKPASEDRYSEPPKPDAELSFDNEFVAVGVWREA